MTVSALLVYECCSKLLAASVCGFHDGDVGADAAVGGAGVGVRIHGNQAAGAATP